MEHLIYKPSARDFRAEIREISKSVRVQGWASADAEYEACTPVQPRTLWLGHNHEASSYFHRADYQPGPAEESFLEHYGHDWDTEGILESGNLRSVHSSLEKLNEADVVLEIAAFVQSWLYLGLLEAVCAKPISVSFCVRSDGGTEWVYTRGLPALLEAWRREVASVEEEFSQARFRKARDCALVADTILANFLKIGTLPSSNPMHIKLRETLLSIEPMLSALHEAIATLVDRQLGSEIRSFNASGSKFPGFSSERLVRKGWCPFVISSAQMGMSPSFLRYVDVAQYAPQDREHEDCSAKVCNRNLIDPDTYDIRHTASTCKCKYLKPSISVIFEILDTGMIPVVQLSADKSELELGGVSPDSTDHEYVAFSHVWADGLGSCSERGLPSCQLERLHQLASKELPKGAGSWFWIDGLCVPKQASYRRTAIQLLKNTYRNATGVVVLDNSMRHLSKSASLLEIGWTLFASGWMGRMWTYQEGFLPPWVDIELKDDLCHLYQIINDTYEAYYKPVPMVNPFPSLFTRDLLAALQKLRPLDRNHKDRSKARKIVDTFNVLTRRQTSRPDDQLLILALSLDVDIDTIMKVAGEERWSQYYLALKEFPWTVLFDHRPKMSLSPFRWAPKTWTSLGKDEWLHYEEELGACSPLGLCISITALVLTGMCSIEELHVLIRTEDDQYELSHETMSTAEMRMFNVVFVRHFKHESPQTNLYTNNTVLMRVGLGLIDQTGHNQLQYDFGGGWDIQQILETPERLSGVKTVTGSWETREFTFT